MEHTITVSELSERHPFFSHAVRCSCGWTAYAINKDQAEGHKSFHEAEVPHVDARRAASLVKAIEDAKKINEVNNG